jgi:hypothetical protein
MAPGNRWYHRDRSREEIQAAMRAEDTEAVNAHLELAELHLQLCAAYNPEPTHECRNCVLTHVCYLDRENVEEEVQTVSVTVDRLQTV